jgi:NADH-quinone oxidoreductase subunit C
MTKKITELMGRLIDDAGLKLGTCDVQRGELNLEVEAPDLLATCYRLRDEYGFEELIDLAGVDYSDFGVSEWETAEASSSGFSRGVEPKAAARFSFENPAPEKKAAGYRFAVVIHLLSVAQNCRVRLKAYCVDDEFPRMDSVVDIWKSADWFEREAFDLFGILFDGHPDLRRILTDYGFVGHPLRKDFPLVGHVEMRYDPNAGRVIYEPVSIEPRVNIPKVIRDDSRYVSDSEDQNDA